MKILFCLPLLLSLLSCSKDNTSPDQSVNHHVDASIGFEIRDNKGMDLLNTKNVGSYSKNDIAIGTVDAQGKFVKNTKTDLFWINSNQTSHYLIIYLPIPEKQSEKDNMYNVYLKIGDNPADTLKVNYISKNIETSATTFGTSFLQKNNVWLNGKLIWEYARKDDPTIAKDLILIKNPKK